MALRRCFEFLSDAVRNVTMKPLTAAFSGSLPEGKDAYVLYYPDSSEFIKPNRLSVWYYDPDTGASVAVGSCRGAEKNVR